MRLMGLFAACGLAVAAGIGIGAIPFVNENLHWNVWFVIPISGLLLGMGLGFGQFQVARASGARVGVVAAGVLALATSIGYLGTDLGTYWTMTVALEQSDDFEAGEYRVRDLMGFEGYMRARLESASIELRPGRSSSPTLELGSTAALTSFFVDALGAWVGAFLALFGSSLRAPYCLRCQRYKRSVGKSELLLDDETAMEDLESLQELAERGDYEAVVSLLNEWAKRPPPTAAALKLATDERVCSGCNEATLHCSVVRRQDGEEVGAMSIDSAAGNTTRLTRS